MIMFNDLQALGMGITVFAVLIGVGTIVLYNMKVSGAQCAATFPFNKTLDLCENATGSTATPGGSFDALDYMEGQMGQSGLAGWAPAVIAISVGLLFLGAFLIKGGSKKGRY